MLNRLKQGILGHLKKREDDYLAGVYKRYLAGNPRVKRILAGEFDKGLDSLAQGRNFPNPERHKEKEWWKTMLLRYGLALHYSKDKGVLDTCSGLGWGLYIVEETVKRITGVELDSRAVSHAGRLWPMQRGRFINGSVLELPIASSSHDVVLAFESIEHFELEQIKVYMREVFRTLVPGGILIGSSYFPHTREQAIRACSLNEHHLYICCKEEFEKILWDIGFKKVKIFRNRLFFAAWK